MAFTGLREVKLGERFNIFPAPFFRIFKNQHKEPYLGHGIGEFPDVQKVPPGYVSTASSVMVRKSQTLFTPRIDLTLQSPTLQDRGNCSLEPTNLIFFGGIDPYQLRDHPSFHSEIKNNQSWPLCKRDELERLALILYGKDTTSLIVPKVNDPPTEYPVIYYQALDMETDSKPTLQDFLRFKKNPLPGVFRLGRDYEDVITLTGAFYIL